MAQRAEHQIQMAEVLNSIVTGVKFCCWIFCFHMVKPLMPIFNKFCVLVNNSIAKVFIDVNLANFCNRQGCRDRPLRAFGMKGSLRIVPFSFYDLSQR